MFGRFLTLVFLTFSSRAVAEDPNLSREAAIDVVSYSLALRPDIETSSISGIESVRFIVKKIRTKSSFLQTPLRSTARQSTATPLKFRRRIKVSSSPHLGSFLQAGRRRCVSFSGVCRNAD